MKFILLVFILMSGVFPARAQTPSSDQAPLEISADQALEWDRANTRYFARKNAVAQQGDFQVHADLLTADYRDRNGRNEIYRITAEGNVKLISGTSQGIGAKAVYTLDDGKAVLSGRDLKLQSEDMIITCEERFEYFVNDGKFIAIGAPIITSQNNKLSADQVTAFLTTDQTGKRTLSRAEAMGNVVITTPTEKATSNRGIYNAQQKTVELIGNVALTQGPNILNGARATMDLTTRLSKMYGAKEGNQRVTGKFYTGSQSPVPRPTPPSKP